MPKRIPSKYSVGLWGHQPEGFAPPPIPEIEIPIGGEILPDTRVWINRFSVPSDTTVNEYVVAQQRNKRWWACSCRGFSTHRKCKHLSRLNLPTNMEPYEARVAITVEVLPKTTYVGKSDKHDFAKPRRRFALPEEDL